MTEKRIYCDICNNQIKSYQVRYILRRRMILIEDDQMGRRRKMDICEDCYNRLVDMAAEGGAS